MMSEEVAGPNCQRQSVIYPDATQDRGCVVCHTCGTCMVAGASFIERHRKRLRDCAGDRFGIIGIDQQGALELDGGASEARQDEDARIVRILSGDIFLRNKVLPSRSGVTRPTRAVR
jgi:hypothetical protein